MTYALLLSTLNCAVRQGGAVGLTEVQLGTTVHQNDSAGRQALLSELR